MKTFSIYTLGCKVNHYESQQIRQLLEQSGLHQAIDQKPDIVVINTCCVTHTASAKSRHNIRQIQKLQPNATIVVCGCLPVIQTDENCDFGQNIHFITHRQELAGTLKQIICKKYATSEPQSISDKPIKAKNVLKSKGKNLTKQPKLPRLTSFEGQTRAFLKVQDGCDGRCSYCIIPKTRPEIWNKPMDEVIEEAKALIGSGHKEIVVTGVNLGAYGQDTVRQRKWKDRRNEKLAEMLGRLAEVEGLARIRLSSLEPGDVTERLMDVFCGHRNLMPHLHLSLQSGSDAVLKRMCRQYKISEFWEKIAMIKERLDRPAITADLIAGFPGETEEDFEKTVDVARETGFAKMHVFAYSERKGTPAERLQDIVNTGVIKRRADFLRRLDAKLGVQFRQQFVGERVSVLIEDMKGMTGGHSERYFVVAIKNGAKMGLKRGDLVNVLITSNSKDGMDGEL